MKLRHSLVCCMLALGTLSAAAMAAGQAEATLGYYRAPALHDQTLVFTAEGDLWTQTLGEPQAHRLTSQAAEELGAVISADGKFVAYVANYDGIGEVYVIPVAGGLAKRVSFENSRVRVQGWTPDGKVLYATDNASGPANYWVLRTVDPQTLTTEDLPLADAVEGVVDARGEYLYFTRFGLQTTGDNAKVYRGGAKGELWRFKLDAKVEAEPLTAAHQGSVRRPMLWQDRLYFISDSDGNANLWSMALDGTDPKQITHYQDWQVRGARMDRGRIVFQQGADIKLFDLASGKDTSLEIALTSDFAQRREHWVTDPMDYATSVSLAPKGDKAVITARSQVAVAATDGSRLVTVNLPGNSRIRNAIMSTDGRWIYGISDASGEQEIWQFPADGSQGAKRLTKDGSTLRMNLYLSADGRFIAHDDYDGNVWLLDLNKHSNKKIIAKGEGLGPYADIRWSPDSRFIALTKSELGKQRPQLVLYSLDQEKAEPLTSDKYESFSPSFSTDGHWLYFLSNRQFVATPNSPWGDRNMGPVFDKRTQVFALALDKRASFPFAKPTELSVQADRDEATDSEVRLKVDWDGLNQRLWQVPVAAGNYTQLAALDDRLYLLDNPDSGDSQSLKLIKFNAQAPKLDTFADGVVDYSVSNDGKKLLLRRQAKGKEVLIVDAGDKLAADVSQAKVPMSQWQLAIEPQQEWQQMFEDAWLMHRDSFFDKQMRGLDWQATKAKYQPLLSRLTDRHELNDIFMQMMGELNALHSQVRGGDMQLAANTPEASSLGARLLQTSAGVKIAHIYQTDPELPSQAAPLRRMGVDAREGDIISAINGQKVADLAEVSRVLRNQAGKQVLLALSRNRQQHKTVVTPIATQADAKLRYLDWVEHNAAKVREASRGKIGYLHLYAMGSGDIASFAREFYTHYDKDGLIIDVRRNRGGNIDSWIIEKLLRRAWAFWQPTYGSPSTNMQQTFRGHLAVLTDQLTYSDGETFSAGIKALGLAPLIGKQTAGAGVWLSGRNAVTDRGMARVAEYPQYAIDGRWVLEGRGVSPDIEVDNLPFATFTGRDAQLEKALSYLEAELKAKPVPPLQGRPMSPGAEAQDIHL
ncbi:S41 family peptidase [Shewanella salipaludis]|uniref:Tricorn protease homolog n=1 Tax=Shewanella salipaludis TaxID=2723052 RepID=A0A972JN50_9GAMM|nr:S41 family peptidase [Shewanella salipaludis]NMH65811.1 peptidase S41 [Shewanella salipaludis]